jgi:hypothetical protein
MRIHLSEIHQELATDLPLKGKGFDMSFRIASFLFATPCSFWAADHGLGPYGGPNSVKSIPTLLLTSG